MNIFKKQFALVIGGIGALAIASTTILVAQSHLARNASPVPTATTLALGVPTALPIAVATDRTTTVAITVAVQNATLLSASPNLLRLTMAGQNPVNLGQLHDDGQNGDAQAGDGVYTIKITLTEHTAATVQLQVSAPVRGALIRTLSPIFTVFATSSGVLPPPPDPGSAGLLTLDGIDSNGDGLRDDVERYIRTSYPSQKVQASLYQVAKAYGALLHDSSSVDLARADGAMLSYAIDCLYYTSPGTAMNEHTEIQQLVVNTRMRMQAYLSAQAAVVSSFDRLPDNETQHQRCAVDPASLTN